MIPQDLLDILVCPETHARLLVTKDGNLVSEDPASRRLYRVEDDIPILLIDESEVLSPEDHARILEEARKLPANQPPGKGSES